MSLRLRALVVGFVVAVSFALPDAADANQPTLTADLEGRAIALTDVSTFYCHDFAWPVIHCFSTPAALERAVAQVATERDPDAASTVEAVSALSYIRVFDWTWYAGAYIYLSQDYNDLSVIGWNDRISSYTGSNNQTSALFVNTYHQGLGFIVCCNNKASTLSSTFDNKISSTERL